MSGARMSCGTSISMPSTMARKSSRLRPKRLHRRDVVLQPRRRMALIQRVDIVAPLLERGQPLVARAIGIGDVVDLPAETVDLEHRLALRRAAGCASRHRTNCRTRSCRNLRWPPPSRASCAGRRFRHGPRVRPRGGRSRRRCRRGCSASNSSGLEMHALAEGIAHLQHADDLVGKGLDHRDLEPEPEIPDLGARATCFR